MHDTVLIAGAGPVGLLVAAELRRYGVPVEIVDSKPEKDTHSKALSVSAATLKTLYGIGIDLSRSPKAAAVHDINVYYDKKRCAHINKRYIKSRFNHYLSIPQPETERLLEEHLNNLGVAVKRGCRVVGLRDDQNGVWVKTETADGQITEEKRYSIVVGCDGSQSTIRQLRGIDFSGNDYDAHMILSDVLFSEGDAVHNVSSYHIDDDGFLVFLPMGAGITRLVIGLNGLRPRGAPPPDLATFQHYLDKYYTKKLFISESIWSSSVRLFSRLASKLRDGHVFLAGDSTHVFSPIGGQGLNTGIQDGFNLAWKLAFYLRGKAHSALLDTYESERHAAITKVAQMTHDDTLQIYQMEEGRTVNPIYTPAMASRALYRTDLANRFSGFDVDHSLGRSAIVGKHVPDFQWDDQGVTASYEIPTIGKNVVFYADEKMERELQFLKPYKDIATAALIHSNDDGISKLKLQNDIICLVRPDGYIGFHGRSTDLRSYMQQLYES